MKSGSNPMCLIARWRLASSAIILLSIFPGFIHSTPVETPIYRVSSTHKYNHPCRDADLSRVSLTHNATPVETPIYRVSSTNKIHQISSKHTWFIGETPYFTYASDCKKRDTVRILEDMQTYRDGFHYSMPLFSRIPDPPLHIVICRDNKSFQKLYRLYNPGTRKNVAGLCSTGDGGTLVLMNAGYGRESSLEIIIHEYIHYQLDKYMDNVPKWLSEGVASCFDEAEIRKDRIIIGKLRQKTVDAVLRNMMPWDEFFNLDPFDFNESNRKTYLFYNQSQAFLHFLVFNKALQNQREDLLERLVDEINRFPPISETFWEIELEMDYEALTAAFVDYLQSGSFEALEIDRDLLPDQLVSLDIRKATGNDKQWMQARIMRLSGHHDLSQQFLNNLEDLTYPHLKWEDLGISAYHAGMSGQSEEYLKKAIERGSKNAYVYYLQGHIIREKLLGVDPFPPQQLSSNDLKTQKALESFSKARESGYLEVELYQDMAAFWMALGPDSFNPSNLDLLKEGLRYSRNDFLLSCQLGTLQARQGDLKEASVIYKRLRNSTTTLQRSAWMDFFEEELDRAAEKSEKQRHGPN